MSDARGIIDDAACAHLGTFSVYRRQRRLDQDYPKRIVRSVLTAVPGCRPSERRSAALDRVFPLVQTWPRAGQSLFIYAVDAAQQSR